MCDARGSNPGACQPPLPVPDIRPHRERAHVFARGHPGVSEQPPLVAGDRRTYAQQRGIEPRSAVLETAVLPLHHCHMHTTRRWRQGGITGIMLRSRGRESNPRTHRSYNLRAYTLLLPHCGGRALHPLHRSVISCSDRLICTASRLHHENPPCNTTRHERSGSRLPLTHFFPSNYILRVRGVKCNPPSRNNLC